MSKFTKYLFLISILFSFLSLISIKKGYGEFYPFYSWKLFSMPSGDTPEVTEFRLYGVNGKTEKRIENTDSELFDGNTKFSLINTYANAIVENKNIAKNKSKLLKFAKTIAPDFQYYLLVEEKYKPQDLGEKNFNFSKKTIVILR